MHKFHVKFTRVFDTELEAADMATAITLMQAVLAQFPKDSCKLLSIIRGGYVEPVVEDHAVAELSKEAKAVLERNEGFAAKVRAFTDPSGVA